MKSLAQQRFGTAAADYATSSVHAKGASLARLVALTQPEADWRVLDVATGAGHTTLAFAPHVASVTATDITEEMLAEARKLATRAGFANVATAFAEAETLPFPAASFELVVCRLAAHHFADVAQFAREAFRVLRSGGVLGIVDTVAPDVALFPDRPVAELRAMAASFEAFKRLADPSHVRCLGLEEWGQVLHGAGFEVTHREWLDKEIEFGPWTFRMRASETTAAQLKAMLHDASLKELLRPRDTGQLAYSLKEGLIIALKPG